MVVAATGFGFVSRQVFDGVSFSGVMGLTGVQVWTERTVDDEVVGIEESNRCSMFKAKTGWTYFGGG